MTLADYRKRRGEPVLDEHAEEVHGEGANHPTAIEYLQIGLILAVITAVEVALYYLDLDYTLLVTLLVILSLAKFLFVVLWFMHLRFDSRLFQVLFATGLIGTMILFAVVLAVTEGKFV
jgi:cytochrome c oxidase subunit IV